MLLSGNSSVTLTAVRLHSNVAVTMGGAVLVGDNCMLSCNQSWFLNNTAGLLGGAIAAVSNATFLLRSCTLLSNNGSSKGGALYLGSSLAQGNVFAVNAANNTAKQGGFAAVSGSAVLNVSGGTFRHNVVSPHGRGGLLYASDMAVVNLKDCTVSGGAHGPGVVGGAFWMDGHVRLTLWACTIADYNAQFGGGLWSNDSSSVHARNCIWRNLAADQSGGGVFLGGVAHSTLHEGRFSGMHAQYGGAIHIMAGSLDVAGTAFDNSTSYFHGGGLLVSNSAAVNLTNCRFNKCSTDSGRGVRYIGDKAQMLSDNGGGAMCIGDNAQVKLVGCSIRRCTAQGVGGALEVGGTTTVNLRRCSLHQNQAKILGGAVMLGGAAHMVAEDSSFAENVCLQTGGALHAGNTSKVHLDHCIVAVNSAAAGSSLCLSDQATLILRSTSIVDNTAQSQGGGVLLGSSRFQLAALKAAVSRNNAPRGADIYALPVALAMRNSSAVHGFVSRVKSDEGLWNTTILVTGPQGLPSSGATVVARLEGAPLTQNRSGEDGMLDLHMKLAGGSMTGS
jgi:predicted outer membrane repeat protein